MTRKLYKIGHLSSLLNITHRTIRYYDQMGLLPLVKRSEGGVRLFDDNDITIIRQIRKMKKEDFLPLEVIKERLFNKKHKEKQSCIVVTDNTASFSKNNLQNLPIRLVNHHLKLGNDDIKHNETNDAIWKKSKKNNVCPITQSPTENDYLNIYKELTDKGYKKIYSIHTSSSMSKAFETAQKAAQKLSNSEIEVIDSKTFGPGLGLLVEMIAEAIKNDESLETINLLISKQIPMVYQIGTIQNFQYLLTGHQQQKDSPTQNQFLKSISNFRPVFTLKDGKGVLSVDACCVNSTEANHLLKETLEQEFQARGKYINRLKVSYNFLFSEAQTLTNEIKASFPNTPVDLEEMSGPASVELGPESITVSII